MTPLENEFIKPRVVFVDWYRTLSNSRFLETWSAPDHPSHQAFLKFQAWWFGKETETFMEAWLRGRVNSGQFVARVADHLGVDPLWLEREIAASCRTWTFLDPEIPYLIAKLRAQGVRVVLATDSVDGFARWAVPAMGIETMFDAVLNSCELGCCKADLDEQGTSRFFTPYLDAEEIRPGESVLVDDYGVLAEVATRSGLEFRHVNEGASAADHLRALLTLADA